MKINKKLTYTTVAIMSVFGRVACGNSSNGQESIEVVGHLVTPSIKLLKISIRRLEVLKGSMLLQHIKVDMMILRQRLWLPLKQVTVPKLFKERSTISWNIFNRDLFKI